MNTYESRPFVLTAGVMLAILAKYKRRDVETGILLDELCDVVSKKSRIIKDGKRIKPDKESVLYFKSCGRQGISRKLFKEQYVNAFESALSKQDGFERRLKRMAGLVDDCLAFEDDDMKPLVVDLLAALSLDATVDGNAVVAFDNAGTSMTKKELLDANVICPEAMLLGLWYYAVKRGGNTDGRAAYNMLFPSSETPKGRRPMAAVPGSDDFMSKAFTLTPYDRVPKPRTELETLWAVLPKKESLRTDVDGFAAFEQQVIRFFDEYEGIAWQDCANQKDRKLGEKAYDLTRKLFCEASALFCLTRYKDCDPDVCSAAAEEAIRRKYDKHCEKYTKLIKKLDEKTSKAVSKKTKKG